MVFCSRLAVKMRSFPACILDSVCIIKLPGPKFGDVGKLLSTTRVTSFEEAKMWLSFCMSILTPAIRRTGFDAVIVAGLRAVLPLNVMF